MFPFVIHMITGTCPLCLNERTSRDVYEEISVCVFLLHTENKFLTAVELRTSTKFWHKNVLRDRDTFFVSQEQVGEWIYGVLRLTQTLLTLA